MCSFAVHELAKLEMIMTNLALIPIFLDRGSAWQLRPTVPFCPGKDQSAIQKLHFCSAEMHSSAALTELYGFCQAALRFLLICRHLKLRSSFEAALRDTLSIGGDPDTNAAIVCGMMGALHGASGIPEALKARCWPTMRRRLEGLLSWCPPRFPTWGIGCTG